MNWFLKLSTSNKIALLGVLVAFAGIVFSLVAQKNPSPINTQSTKGSNSPAVNSSGNVTINYSIDNIEKTSSTKKNIKISRNVSLKDDESISCKSNISIIYPKIVYSNNSFKEERTNNIIIEAIKNITGVNVQNDLSEFDSYCDISINYELIYRVDNIIGVAINYNVHGLGAANYRIGSKYVNINLENSSIFEFKDIFTSKGIIDISEMVYSKIDNKKVKLPQFKTVDKETLLDCARTVPDPNRGYPITKEMVSNEIFGGPDFFFSNNEVITINFTQHSLTAGYCGNLQVSFPFKDIKHIINPNGPLAFIL